MDSLLSFVGDCSTMIVADFSVKQLQARATALNNNVIRLILYCIYIEKYTNFFFDEYSRRWGENHAASCWHAWGWAEAGRRKDQER